jgi:hypothetical protein
MDPPVAAALIAGAAGVYGVASLQPLTDSRPICAAPGPCPDGGPTSATCVPGSRDRAHPARLPMLQDCPSQPVDCRPQPRGPSNHVRHPAPRSGLWVRHTAANRRSSLRRLLGRAGSSKLPLPFRSSSYCMGATICRRIPTRSSPGGLELPLWALATTIWPDGRRYMPMRHLALFIGRAGMG